MKVIIRKLEETGVITETTEPVKIQGYTELPTKRPPAGKFTTYKGTSLNPAVEIYPDYFIHPNVRKCENWE